MDEVTAPNELNARLDALIQRLIEVDQLGSGMEPIELAHELGEIKLLVARRQTIQPRPGGERHWRCESCGIITHAGTKPERCAACGATQLWPADIAPPKI